MITTRVAAAAVTVLGFAATAALAGPEQGWYGRYNRPAAQSRYVAPVEWEQPDRFGGNDFAPRPANGAIAFVVGLYEEVLGRTPAPHEVNGWLVRLDQVGGCRETLSRDFVAAAQYELSLRHGPRGASWHGAPHATVVVPARPTVSFRVNVRKGW